MIPTPSYFEQKGFTITSSVLDDHALGLLAHEIQKLTPDTEKKKSSSFRFWPKHSPKIMEILLTSPAGELLSSIFKNDFFPVRGIFFNKAPSSNWGVLWHQDLVIAVKEKKNIPGFSQWTKKDEVNYVNAPKELLERIVTLRIHLDDCTEKNGPLIVISASHKLGCLTNTRIEKLVSTNKQEVCLVPRGGILMMRPLLVHSSSRSTEDLPRRVIHLEFAAELLPGGLIWNNQV
jgi:hypothetical protein